VQGSNLINSIKVSAWLIYFLMFYLTCFNSVVYFSMITLLLSVKFIKANYIDTSNYLWQFWEYMLTAIHT
jgi:hypothetical protein